MTRYEQIKEAMADGIRRTAMDATRKAGLEPIKETSVRTILEQMTGQGYLERNNPERAKGTRTHYWRKRP